MDNHHETSEQSKKYNCIAWALNINDDKWAPYTGRTWFVGLKKYHNFTGNDVQEHKDGFQTVGYEECQDGSLEIGFEKIAFYVKDGSVEHIARQLENGHWTSKLGEHYEDIEHYTLEALEGTLYGNAEVFMKRKKPHKIIKTIKEVKKFFGIKKV